ncbi:proline-rich protein 5 isoform X3, partial [Silurus asotus]
KRLLQHRPNLGDSSARNLVVRSKSYNVPMLTPVEEYETETTLVGSSGIRRHSVCQMTLCQEEPAFSSITSSPETNPPSQLSASHPSVQQEPALSGCREQTVFSQSPETITDQLLESLDSKSEGIFIDFSYHCSHSSTFSPESESESVV